MYGNVKFSQQQLKKMLADDPVAVSSSKLVLSSIILSLIIVLAIFVWATLIDIEEVSTAPGTIVPISKNQLVQIDSGGTIAQILVANGDEVALDQPLLVLNNEAANTELEQLQDQSVELQVEDRANKSTIVANKDGYIQGLNVDVGTMLYPGEVICEIVPTDKKYIVEAKVPEHDIDHIKVGETVKVKISTYHSATHGYLSGKISSISTSATTDENGLSYYAAIIDLEQKDLHNESPNNVLLPGMMVTTDIVTNRKSLLAYMLKPVYNLKL